MRRPCGCMASRRWVSPARRCGRSAGPQTSLMSRRFTSSLNRTPAAKPCVRGSVSPAFAIASDSCLSTAPKMSASCTAGPGELSPSVATGGQCRHLLAGGSLGGAAASDYGGVPLLAQPLLDAPDLLDQLGAAIRDAGYTGDPRPPLIAYVALTSRLLERPINVAFVAPSGAGKNRAVDAALAFVPAEAVHELKAGTPRALIYSDADLAHRYVIVAEADSLPEDGPAASAVRSLVTDSRFIYEVVEHNPKTGQHGTRRIEKNGPTGLITTGTKSLRTQLSTRTLEVPLRDDAEQTRAIMWAQAHAVDDTPKARPDYAPFLALQQWLELGGERRVTVPFSAALAALLPADAVRMRRDFPQMLTAIRSLALLQQRRRVRSATGAIEAAIEDYAAVRYLLADVFDGIATEGLTPVMRQTVDAVGPDEAITLTALATRLAIAKSTASHRVSRAVARGWLVNTETRKGCPAKLSRGEPLPDDASVLPLPDRVWEVFECSPPAPGASPPPPRPSGDAEEDR